MDVTRRKRGEALRDGEAMFLEMIARDAPLEEILENLVRVLESQLTVALLCPALDEDGQHARHAPRPAFRALQLGHRRPLHRTEGGIMRHGHVPQRTCLSSPTFSRIRSGRRTEARPSLMGSAPAGPLPYLRISARC